MPFEQECAIYLAAILKLRAASPLETGFIVCDLVRTPLGRPFGRPLISLGRPLSWEGSLGRPLACAAMVADTQGFFKRECEGRRDAELPRGCELRVQDEYLKSLGTKSA